MNLRPVKQLRALAAIAAGASTTTHIRSVLQQPSIQCAQSVMRQLEHKGFVRRAGRGTDMLVVIDNWNVRQNNIVYRPTALGIAVLGSGVRDGE